MSETIELLRLQEEIKKLTEVNENLQREKQGLLDLIATLRRKQYGAKSERVTSEQLGLFNEVELEGLSPEPEEEDEEESITVPSHERKKRGKRLKLPESLPRVEVVLDLENKSCSHDGSPLKCIGEEISEKLEIIPAKVRVIRTIRKKYACPKCEEISEVKPPAEMIPKSIASPTLLAYIATAKYVDSLPLYRQEAIFKRIGIDLPRQTMARWMITLGARIEPLIKLMREELLKSSYIHMDETSVQVLKEDGKKAESKSYMWVQARSGENPIILFHYSKNRSGDNAQELLDDFKGYLHVDGYDGYQSVCTLNKITRLGCWAHLRRKFFDAFKSSQGSSIGKQALVFIKKIYEIEEKIRGMSAEERLRIRTKDSLPLILSFKDWINEKREKTTPGSLAGKALHYAINEWEYLQNCFSSGETEIDNNFIESHIRPFTIGRKNWMFSVTPEGAMASAHLYSLVETAKANNRDPFEYLSEVVKNLPLAETEKDFLKLLPIKITV